MNKFTKITKVLSIVICLAMLVGILGSCKKGNEVNNDNTFSTEAGNTTGRPETPGNSESPDSSETPGETQDTTGTPDSSGTTGATGTTGNSTSKPTNTSTNKPTQTNPPTPTPTQTPVSNKWTNQSSAPTVDTLLDTSSTQERWLSIPDSRLVINPFSYEGKNTNKSQSEVLNSPMLPLHVGYLDPRLNNVDGKGMNDSVIMFEKTSDSGSGSHVWGQDLTKAGWTLNNSTDSTLSLSSGRMVLGVKNTAGLSYQFASAPVSVNVDSSSQISITVSSVTGGEWALKINTGSEEDIPIKRDSTDKGTFTFNLKDYIGTGNKSARIILYAIGFGSSVTVDKLTVTGKIGSTNEASSYTTSWQPHKLNFSASYAGGNKITGEDFFYDTKTIVRTISVTGGNKMLIGGQLYGTASISGNTITITNSSKHRYMIAAITIQGASGIKLYSSLGNLKAGTTGGSAYWGVEVAPTNGKIVISYALDSKELSSVSQVQTMSKNPITKNDYAAKLNSRKTEWNSFLAKVPRAGDVKFTQINSKGVTSAEVKEMYYEAWCLIHASVLPANPELGFNHRQIPTGKPSMWGYGDPKSTYTAQWDSLYAMQMYSYIDPDIAWDCFVGLMSSVDMTPNTPTYGMIHGESLPNMTSRTAWILYQNKPDKNKLSQVYAQLDQHQEWCMDHPYWIFQNNNPLNSNAKDTDFTAAVLVDIPYLIKIAKELGKTSKVTYWQNEFNKYLNNFYSWHGGYYSGWTLWFTKALYIPEMKSTFDKKLYNEVMDDFDKNKTFCGFGGVKLEEIMYTIYGLLDNGYKSEAYALAESSVRDVVRAQFLAESYSSDSVPQGTGVRPSMFGAVQLIDSVWILNGFRYDSGTPKVHTYFNGGYIENLKVNGKIFNAKVSGGEVTMAGTYFKNGIKANIGKDKFYTP